MGSTLSNLFSSGDDEAISPAFIFREENTRAIQKDVHRLREQMRESKEALLHIAACLGNSFFTMGGAVAKLRQPGLRCVELNEAETSEADGPGDTTRRAATARSAVRRETETGLSLQRQTQANTICVHAQRLTGYTTPFTSGEERKRIDTLMSSQVYSSLDKVDQKLSSVLAVAKLVRRDFEAFNKAQKLLKRKEMSYATKKKDTSSAKMTSYRNESQRKLEAYRHRMTEFDRKYEEALDVSIYLFSSMYVEWMLEFNGYMASLVHELGLAVAPDADDGSPVGPEAGGGGEAKQPPVVRGNAAALLHVDQEMVSALSVMRTFTQRDATYLGGAVRDHASPDPTAPSAARHPPPNEPFPFDPVVKPPPPGSSDDPFAASLPLSPTAPDSFARRDGEEAKSRHQKYGRKGFDMRCTFYLFIYVSPRLSSSSRWHYYCTETVTDSIRLAARSEAAAQIVGGAELVVLPTPVSRHHCDGLLTHTSGGTDAFGCCPHHPFLSGPPAAHHREAAGNAIRPALPATPSGPGRQRRLRGRSAGRSGRKAEKKGAVDAAQKKFVSAANCASQGVPRSSSSTGDIDPGWDPCEALRQLRLSLAVDVAPQLRRPPPPAPPPLFPPSPAAVAPLSLPTLSAAGHHGLGGLAHGTAVRHTAVYDLADLDAACGAWLQWCRRRQARQPSAPLSAAAGAAAAATVARRYVREAQQRRRCLAHLTDVGGLPSGCGTKVAEAEAEATRHTCLTGAELLRRMRLVRSFQVSARRALLSSDSGGSGADGKAAQDDLLQRLRQLSLLAPLLQEASRKCQMVHALRSGSSPTGAAAPPGGPRVRWCASAPLSEGLAAYSAALQQTATGVMAASLQRLDANMSSLEARLAGLGLGVRAPNTQGYVHTMCMRTAVCTPRRGPRRAVHLTFESPQATKNMPCGTAARTAPLHSPPVTCHLPPPSLSLSLSPFDRFDTYRLNAHPSENFKLHCPAYCILRLAYLRPTLSPTLSYSLALSHWYRWAAASSEQRDLNITKRRK
eukprot:gene11541-7960_t